MVLSAPDLPINAYYFIDKNFSTSTIKGSELITKLTNLGFTKIYNISADESFFTDQALKMERKEIDHFFN